MNKNFPKVWMTSYWPSDAKGKALPPNPATYADLAAHGVQGVDLYGNIVKEDLELARKYGLKLSWVFRHGLPADVLKSHGIERECAVAIGGTYNYLSIDSHTFPFAAGTHAIDIYPPVHYAPYDAGTKLYLTDNTTFGKYLFSDTSMVAKAEVVVARKLFDGRQHLTIVPAEITRRNKDHVTLSFQLTGEEGDLQNTMIAVYWKTGSDSPSAEATRQAKTLAIRKSLDDLIRENGGTFPHDVVCAMRYEDEGFLHTGFAHSPMCSIPLYDYSKSGIRGFQALNAADDFPRTWAFPEIYGVNAYRDWLYSFHQATAELVRIAVSEVHKIAPDVRVFRNITRFNPTNFATLPNDHDGCSTQLLTEQFDMISPDPYPVARTGDSQSANPDREPRTGYIESMIPLECAYFSGLTKRMGKPLFPWIQSHAFMKDLAHSSSSDALHLYGQVVKANPDGIFWLGYRADHTADGHGMTCTIPDARPNTWKTIGNINKRAPRDLGRPESPREIAVLRFYAERALVDLERHSPYDRFLTERLLGALTLDLDEPYDIYEYYKREDLQANVLKRYHRVFLCVDDLEGLPLAELSEAKIPLSIVCFNGKSLAAHPEFTGVSEFRQLEQPQVIKAKGAALSIGADLAFAVALNDPSAGIASSGEQCCLWQWKQARFASFIPSDPFDDAEYTRWLMK